MSDSQSLVMAVRYPCRMIVFDSDPVSSECHIAAGITKLSDGQQWLSGQLQDNVTMACHKQQSWQIKVSFMGGLEDCTRWCVDLDWFKSRAFIANQGGTGEEVVLCSQSQQWHRKVGWENQWQS